MRRNTRTGFKHTIYDTHNMAAFCTPLSPMIRTLLIALSVITLSACSLFPTEGDAPGDESAELLYKEGKAALDSGDYQTAIERFETLEARYPFGRYAQQALLEIAYAYYKYDEPDSAITTAERFIKLYPQHEHTDYAYYIRGLASYNLARGFLDRMFDVDPSERNPRRARESFQYFSELVQRFPDSEYSQDALQRMVQLRNNLARYEVHVANYYFKRSAFLAAANRARYVVENYDRTPSIPDALGIMIKSYRKLDLDQLAKDTQQILELNYPDHPLVAKSPRKELQQNGAPPPQQQQE